MIWNCSDYNRFLQDKQLRRGIRLRFDPGVDPAVRQAILDFTSWVRQSYDFPLRLVVYVKAAERIKAKDGDMVFGTFFRPYDYPVEPYVRLATGDYSALEEARGRDNALAVILSSLAHEITHYYQYINKADLSLRGEEIQASRTASIILNLYAQTRDHP